jgi:import receptor subunit TOM70
MASFVQQNKVAVTVTALLGIGTLAGIIYYMSQNSTSSGAGSASGESSTASKKKKKHSKKKKGGNSATPPPTGSSGSTEVVAEDPATSLYPIDPSTKLPAITSDVLSTLSTEKKEEWALSLKEKGNEYFKAKQYEKAIVYYTNALDCKKDHIFYGNRSACYYALKDYDNTIKDTTSALELKSDYTKCLLRRAHVYEEIGRFEDAMFDLTALSIFGGLSDKTNESYLERVLAKQATKMNDEVYSNLPKVLPSSSSICSFLGAFAKEDIDLDLEKYEEGSGVYYLVKALNEINKDTDEGYESADDALNQAVQRFEKGEYKKGEENLVAIAYEYMGVFAFLKTVDSAVGYVEKALKLYPRPRMYVILALIAADKGDYLKAEEQFAQAIKMNPEDSNIYYHCGQVYYLIGDLKKAQANFENEKKLNPKNVYAYIQLACITYRHNEIEKCLEQFTKAKSEFPLSPEIPNYLGEILFDKGDAEAASKQFDVAIKLQEALPGNNIGVLPLINKSVIFQKLGDFDASLKLLEKAVKIDPKSEVAWTSLGQLYLMKTMIPQAIECFERACKLCRSAEDRKQTISLLESAKIQERVKHNPVLNREMEKLIAKYNAEAAAHAFAQQ